MTLNNYEKKNDTALKNTSIEYNKWHVLYVAATSFEKASRKKANYTSSLVATCPLAKKILKAGVVIMAYYSKSLIGLCRNRN